MAAIIYEGVDVMGTDISFQVGVKYGDDGKCVAIGVNPVPPLPFVALAIEFGADDAEQNDPANHKKVFMVSPMHVVAEVRVEDGPAPVEIVKPRFIMPGQE